MKEKTRKQRFNELIKADNKNLNATVIELAERFLKYFPESPSVWSMYSLALFSLSRNIEAKKALHKTINLFKEKNENLGWLFHRMGRFHHDSGSYKKAIEWFDKAHSALPEEATFLIYKGITFLRLEMLKEAENTFRMATKCKEGCIDEAFYNLAVACISQRKYKNARLYLEKALEIDPKYKEAKKLLEDTLQAVSVQNR